MINLGQYTLVAAGEKIMVLADEESVWVEARVPPNKMLDLPVSISAKIEFSEKFHPATVIQEAHTIDPSRRTRNIRLSVENKDDNLHSGMIVNVFFQIETKNSLLVVPETVLMRSADGD